LNDEKILSEGVLPPILEFDTLYYFDITDDKDESSFRAAFKLE
jgi:hypothetical protein